MKPARRPVTYWGIAGISFAAMVGSFAPSPLYNWYQERWTMADSTVGIAFAGYGMGSVVVLTLFGGLSDVWGRRRALIFGVIGYGAALVLLALAFSPGSLIGARILQGAFTAVLTSTAAAILMESHPSGAVHKGAAVNGIALFAGTALGPLLAGLLVTGGPFPYQSPYALTLMFLIVCSVAAGGMLSRPARVSGRLVRLIHVPREQLGPFLLGAGAIAVHNVSIGVFGTFAGTLAAATGHRLPADAGFLMFVLMALVTVAQCCLRRMASQRLILVGAIVAAVGWGLFALSIAGGWFVLLGAVAVIGMGGGMLFLGGSSIVGQIAPPGRRAEMYSASMLAAFVVLMCSSTFFGVGLGFVGTAQASVVTAGIAMGFTAPILLGAVVVRRLLPGDGGPPMGETALR